MGYIKLICFCIWAVQKIDGLRDKKVTPKRSGQVLTWITAAFIALQVASGIALTVFGCLIQSVPSENLPASVHLPIVWWIGIVPIITGILGIIVVIRRLRKHIVIWILVNGALCLGDGILMSYTNVLDDSAYGLHSFDIERCKEMSWIDPISTTTTTTTRSPYVLHFYNDDNDDVSSSSDNQPPLSCDMVKTLGVYLLPGLTYALLTYLGLVVFVTVFASVIGCCLQECAEDQSLGGPEFVPVEQTINRPIMTQSYMPSGHGPYPGQPGEMFAPVHGMHQQTNQWQGQYAPPPQSSLPPGYISHDPYGNPPQFRPAQAPSHVQPSAPQQDNARASDDSEGFQVESDRKFLV